MRDPLLWVGLFFGFCWGLLCPYLMHYAADVRDRAKGQRLDIETRERRQMACKGQ